MLYAGNSKTFLFECQPNPPDKPANYNGYDPKQKNAERALSNILIRVHQVTSNPQQDPYSRSGNPEAKLPV